MAFVHSRVCAFELVKVLESCCLLQNSFLDSISRFRYSESMARACLLFRCSVSKWEVSGDEKVTNLQI